MLFAFCYGIGAAAFGGLIMLMLINRRPRALGLLVLAACVVTLCWAITAAVQPWWHPGIAHAGDSLRSAAWLLVVTLTISAAAKSNGEPGNVTLFAVLAGAIGVANFANDCRFLFVAASPEALVASQVLARVVVSVAGVLAIENLIRNISPGRRWHAIPLCIALGVMFAYDLYVFSEAVVLKTVSPALDAGRGVVLALVAPLLVLTMSRNPDWNIDIHVSRRVVFHGVTLTAAGIFLLAAAGAAGLIGRFPGEWARVSEIALLCGSVILLLVVLSTESIRSRLRRLIAENFFSTRYDYRAEWLRTIATLSSAGVDEPLNARVIRALGDVVDSPGGGLWLTDELGEYHLVQRVGIALETPVGVSGSGEFVRAMRGGDSILDLTSDVVSVPAWVSRAKLWLAVPLTKVDRLVGFVVLSSPRAPAVLNWESCDVLLAIGQQAASYLEEEHATRTLVESQSLIEYSRRFSFVIHDIKNVSGQLGLMIANIARFGDRPEFRADMLRGLEGAADKLDVLMKRLRADTGESSEPLLADPAEVALQVSHELNRDGAPVRALVAEGGWRTSMAPTDLHAVLTHLITNAVEASTNGDEVTVRLKSDSRAAVVEISDKGEGMSAEFVRNSLFVPRKSTKPGGHGMGAYQARHLLRAAGGDLEVITAVGRGTTMRVILPVAKTDHRVRGELVS